MKRQVIGKRGVKVRNLNRRRSVRHHCHMCCDFDWQAVIDCNNAQCPLHPFRIGNHNCLGFGPEQRAASISLFCLQCSGGDPMVRQDCEAVTCALHPYRLGFSEGGCEDGPAHDND